MALYGFHRVLIAVSIVSDVFFTWFCVRKFNRTDDWMNLVWGGGSTLVVIAMVLYLVHFNRKTAILKAELEKQWLCPSCQYDLRGTLPPGTVRCPECGAAIEEGTSTGPQAEKSAEGVSR
jgi:rubredoxin